ncbi:Uncharacterised protein [Mycobacteroides abscessus subsp. abscessus]|nr:Uncharacterised protein [Mycobacteroides abscessus subsp. abscessus]
MAHTGFVQMGGRSIHREIDQFLGLGVQVVLAPRDRGEIDIGRQQFRSQIQDRLPGIVPRLVHIDDGLLHPIPVW